jgi:hypothetical protein
VAVSHFGLKSLTREKIYAAGNGIADWLGLPGWTEVITMQNPKRVGQMRKLLRAAS